MWSNVTFVVDAKQVDALNDLLEMFLVHAITSENAGNDEFYEVAFPGTPDWQKVAVTALFDSETNLEPIIAFIHKQLDDEIPTKIEQLVDQDWQRVWLKSFKPIKVGTNLWICPSWCEPTEASARNIILDPGLAFGTGTHATTNMCLHWLADQSLNDKSVLDYGSGSGILAIAALFSGASHADAVDIDPHSIDACNQNAKRNNVATTMSAFLPKQIPVKQYDLVIANILASVIIELRDILVSHLATNGVLLLTGILNTQLDLVRNAFGEKFNYTTISKDQWCLLICTNRVS